MKPHPAPASGRGDSLSNELERVGREGRYIYNVFFQYISAYIIRYDIKFVYGRYYAKRSGADSDIKTGAGPQTFDPDWTYPDCLHCIIFGS